jgi:hypothetical protein
MLRDARGQVLVLVARALPLFFAVCLLMLDALAAVRREAGAANAVDAATLACHIHGGGTLLAGPLVCGAIDVDGSGPAAFTFPPVNQLEGGDTTATTYAKLGSDWRSRAGAPRFPKALREEISPRSAAEDWT